MFTSSHWIRAACSISIPRIPNIRTFGPAIEARLESHYGPVFLAELDDALEPEFPRIVLPSAHQHSQIQISQVSLNLTVTFTPDWQVAPEKGEAYLHERFQLLRSVIQDLPGAEPKFTGVSFEIHLPSSATDRAIVDEIARRLASPALQQHALDLEIKRASVVDARFFRNVVIRNYRLYPAALVASEAQPMPLADAFQRGVAITIDFNDRHAFNERPGYRSTEADAKAVLDGAFAAAREATTLLMNPS